MPDLYVSLAATEPARLPDSAFRPVRPVRETFTKVVETTDDDRLAIWTLGLCDLPAQ